MLIIPEPEISGDQAQVTILWHMDEGATQRQFNLRLKRDKGQWRVTEAQDHTLYH